MHSDSSPPQRSLTWSPLWHSDCGCAHHAVTRERCFFRGQRKILKYSHLSTTGSIYPMRAEISTTFHGLGARAEKENPTPCL